MLDLDEWFMHDFGNLIIKREAKVHYRNGGSLISIFE
jgi:hypothetical protein